MSVGRRLGLLGAALTAVAGCDPAASRDPGEARVQVGDTTIVRVGTPAWSDTASLVEEVAIGVLEGPEEYQFGAFLDIAVDADGGVYVFDAQRPALRYYDPSGAYRRTLGGEGQGPGEYQDQSLGLAVRSGDGRIVMRDPRNGRINVYEPDGSPSESWPVSSGLFTADAFRLDTVDHMYLRILTERPEPNEVWPIALMHMDAGGQIVDTLVPPILPNEPESDGGVFGVAKVWTLSPLGGLVAGVNGRYAFEHHRPDGTVLRVERDVEPVPVADGERREYEDLNAWRRRTDPDDPNVIPPVPRTKPAYRSISVGERGRIWVRRYVVAEQGEPVERSAPRGMEPRPPMSWHEPTVYDVFGPDGAFLGSVRVPDRTTLSVFRGDTVWGVRRGAFDEPTVVRFRVSVDG